MSYSNNTNKNDEKNTSKKRKIDDEQEKRDMLKDQLQLLSLKYDEEPQYNTDTEMTSEDENETEEEIF
jgi:hypothetical protein